jgi:hypothetical protein
MLHDLGDGPAIGTRFELPLGFRESLYGLNHAIAGLSQIAKGLLPFWWRHVRGRGSGRETERAQKQY